MAGLIHTGSADRIEASRVSPAERLARLEKLSRLLDEAIAIPGTNFRIGWDTLIGLVPGLGDLATGAMSAYIIDQARRTGVSRWTLTRMIGNTAIDVLVGMIPIAGDLFDAGWKSNVKNVRLLKRNLARRGDLSSLASRQPPQPGRA